MKGSQPAPYLPLGAKSGILGRVDATAYLETLTARLQTAGFELVEEPAGSFTFFRQTAGKAIDVNTVVVARPTVDVSPERLRDASASAFAFARTLAAARRPGRRARMMVYAVLVADRVDDRAREFVAKFHPKHWMVGELPVLVDLAAGDVCMLKRRPLWGGAYFSGCRRDVAAWFSAG